MSSLRAPWQNDTYKSKHTEDHKNTQNTKTQHTFRILFEVYKGQQSNKLQKGVVVPVHCLSSQCVLSAGLLDMGITLSFILYFSYD